MKIKKGDTVVVLTGKDKGKKAKVLEVLRDKNKVVLEGLNMYKKHERPRKQGQKGQVVERPMPIHASNVALFSDKDKKGVRIASEMKGDKKIRVASKSRAAL